MEIVPTLVVTNTGLEPLMYVYGLRRIAQGESRVCHEAAYNRSFLTFDNVSMLGCLPTQSLLHAILSSQGNNSE